jgi:hypothetical protein
MVHVEWLPVAVRPYDADILPARGAHGRVRCPGSDKAETLSRCRASPPPPDGGGGWEADAGSPWDE